MKVYRKEKGAEKFEFEPWPHPSRFNSWKVSFRGVVTSRSSHPRGVSDWSAEIDHETGMDDFGFVFRKNIEESAGTFARFRYLKLLMLVMFVEFDFVPVKLLRMSKT